MGQRTSRRQKELAEKSQSILTGEKRFSRETLIYSLLLLVFTVALYSPVRNHAFLAYDDPDYVANNAHVTAGLQLRTISWALTSTEFSNWHPVTWISHALDCQLFGLDASYHHLTSVMIHAVNAVLLFLLLRRATGANTCSFLVAALFAWHPLNVQSVAWVAERKNVLSTLFFLLAIWAYGWYTQKPQLRRMMLVAVVFVLALAAKPMAVSFPFVLLLLDYWPLQRVARWTQPAPRFPASQRPVAQLFVEKSPLFALSVISSAITIFAQRSGHALRSLQTFSFGTRLGNALCSYVVYIRKALWPSDLAVYYPHPGNALAVWKPLAAAVILVAFSVLVWKQRNVHPYFTVGWLWFLGTLLPVIGIVQVGDQAMADRYAYLPLIGLLVIAVWAVSGLLDKIQAGAALRIAVACTVIAAFCFLTSHELRYWKSDIDLWSHALQVTGGNASVEKQLANALLLTGSAQEALPHLMVAAKAYPDDTATHVNLGVSYLTTGQVRDAIREYETAVHLTQLHPQDQQFQASALLDMGIAYILIGDYPNALTSFQRANQSNPDRVDQAIAGIEQALAKNTTEVGYLKLSLLEKAKGNTGEASSVLETAMEANPQYVHTRELLGYLQTISN